MDLRTQGRKLNASREQSFPSHSPRGSFCGGKCLVKADVHNMKSTPPDGNFPHAVAFLNQSYVTSPVVSPTKTSDIPVTSDVGIPSSSTEEACDGPKAAASPLRNEKQAAEDYCHYAGLSTSVWPFSRKATCGFCSCIMSSERIMREASSLGTEKVLQLSSNPKVPTNICYNHLSFNRSCKTLNFCHRSQRFVIFPSIRFNTNVIYVKRAPSALYSFVEQIFWWIPWKCKLPSAQKSSFCDDKSFRNICKYWKAL